jgi:hypothetical protein
MQQVVEDVDGVCVAGSQPALHDARGLCHVSIVPDPTGSLPGFGEYRLLQLPGARSSASPLPRNLRRVSAMVGWCDMTAMRCRPGSGGSLSEWAQ